MDHERLTSVTSTLEQLVKTLKTRPIKATDSGCQMYQIMLEQ